MKRDIFLYALILLLLVNLYFLRERMEQQEAITNVLSTKFETKVEYLDQLSGRKPRAETLREELERIERLSQ